ncbi:MAG: ABC transporter substrate-binding protein [Nitrospinota bacterium]
MNRKLVSALAPAFALALAAALVGGGMSPAEAQERFHIGMPVPIPNLVHSVVYVAKELGYFRAEGLRVKISSFRGGTRTHQALIGKGSDLDMADIPGPLLLAGIAKGSGMKVVYSFAAKNEAMLVTAPDIKSVAQLRGRKLGIEGTGGYSHIGMLSVMEKYGLGDKDVTYHRTPPPRRVAFLLTGKVDAVLIHIEQYYFLREKKPVNELARIWREAPHYLYAAFGAPEAKLKANREAYVKAVRAIIKATRWAYGNKEGMVRLARKFGRRESPEVLRRAYDVLKGGRIWAVNGGLPWRTMEWTHKLNKRLKRYKGTPPRVAAMVDYSIILDALKTVGVWGPPWDPAH